MRKRTIALVLAAALVALPFLLLGAAAALPATQPGAPNPIVSTDLIEAGPWHTIEIVTLADGTQLERIGINGPPQPPPGFEAERAPVTPPVGRSPNAATLAVPAYNWVFGCSSVSAAMIGGYFDRNGLPNIYTGPANGGVMPMDNSGWPKWTDGAGKQYPSLPLAASRNGIDGRTTRGSIDDYWVANDSLAPDPFITGGWTQHAWGDAFGDYMKTSQSKYDNRDGETTFYNWDSNAGPLTCAQMATEGVAEWDGSYGRKLFYEKRGYSVTDCYNQKTNNNGGGFTFAHYKAQIDAGYPVMVNLKGHTVVGVGYQEPSAITIHDTWDYQTHQMTWGGSYQGMVMQSVSIVNPVWPGPGPTPTRPPTTSGRLYLPAAMHIRATAPTGPTPGRWENPRNELWFHVTPNRAAIDKFAFEVTLYQCGTWTITHLIKEPIAGMRFAFGGEFYASGTFSSATAAAGTVGLDDFCIDECGYCYTGGPWNWTATWKNNSQPAVITIGIDRANGVEAVAWPALSAYRAR